MPLRGPMRTGPTRNGSPCNNMWEMERRYSVPAQEHSVIGSETKMPRRSQISHHTGTLPTNSAHSAMTASASEDLHAWSIYRQNLNSDFTDSALGSSEKSPLPYGNFQLRESTVQSILSHPRYGPKSPLGSNMYTYLKFGLPRVFPPNGSRHRDGSSGYDSSDDGMSPRNAPHKKSQAYYLRARSDPDFRNHQPYYGSTIRQSGANIRGKSVSEANLLSTEAMTRHTRLPSKSYRRSMHDLRTMSEFGSPLAPHYPHHHPPSSHLGNGRPASIAALSSRGGVSQSMIDMSGLARGNHVHSMIDGHAPSMMGTHLSHMETIPASFHVSRNDVYNGLYPHLQIRGLDVEIKKNEPYLQGISFEVKAGELLAVMSTTVNEGKVLLDALASRRKAHVQHVILNGQNIILSSLEKRLTYVRHDAQLSPDLNVAQTLTFHSHLRHPPKTAVGKTSVSDQIGVLIQELGLSQVLNTSVSELTPSEIQRLKIACYLLSDADIILLDRPTSGMDIFDTFFLVEFLRQWANGGSSGLVGKIIILTLQPPTYEIFTMVSRVALISSGRMMFYGRRRDMLPYFASVDYPCPAYKNPSDYYLDLVTLDELSAEAMLESSQRIEQLAEVFKHRQEPLNEPGPIQPLPGKPRSASFLFQIIAIVLRHMVYSQPKSFVRWLSHVLVAVFLSMFVGSVFWDVPASDPQLILNDRIGFHYTIAHVASFPLLLLRSLARTHGSDRAAVESDIADKLYSSSVYIIIMLLCQLPPSLVVWLVYLVPSYAMSSLYQQGDDPDAFYIYLGYMLIHMIGLQSILTLIGYLLPNRFSSTIAGVVILFLLNFTSGLSLHLKDLSPWMREWFGIVSPTRWILPILLRREFSIETLSSHSSHFVCRNKQVQHQDIIVQLPCPTPNGTAALHYYGLLPQEALPFHLRHFGPTWNALFCYAVPAVITIFVFVCIGRICSKKSQKVHYS
ncbi:ATP-binding cassette sub-family G member 8 isoform X2 [Planococcus citri]|uniref:ATP-binding cassette sub-family G member 8 isoform X2 n=1 Tax=Planococcus citri TaxID=170843 RepID=UPI0031F87A79